MKNHKKAIIISAFIVSAIIVGYVWYKYANPAQKNIKITVVDTPIEKTTTV